MIGPVIGGYVLLVVLLVAVAGTSTAIEGPSDGTGVEAFFVVAILLWLAAVVGGAVAWVVKTNGALNGYWRSVGAG